MASGKDIIKYNVNMDTDKLITYKDVSNKLNNLCQADIQTIIM